MNVQQFKEAIPILFKCKVTPLITGVHGIGKSQCVKQVVAPIGRVWDFRLGQCSDVGDLTGLLDIANSDDFCKFKIPARIYEIIQYCEDNPDKYGVMFFDEVNRTTKDILQAVFQIVLDHELNGTVFPSNMRCIAAQNPSTDDYTTLDFDDDAFLDRFCQLRFEPTVEDWLDYARNEKVDPTITGFIGEQNEMLESDQQEYELKVKPSRRTWMLVNEIKKNCFSNSMFRELVLGMVGVTTAASYFEYLSKHDKALKAKDILDDFKKVKPIIKSYSTNEESRADIIDNICNQIFAELEEVDQLSVTWEKNLVEFLTIIPKDKGYGFVTKLFDVPSFRNTKTTPEGGLSEGKSKPSIKLLKHFEGWSEEIKKESKVESDE
jgi:hypothetical protein